MLEVKLISAKHLLRGFDFLYKFKTSLGLLHSPPLPAGKGKQKAVFLLSDCTREWHVILPLLELPLFFTMLLRTFLKLSVPQSSLPSMLQPTCACIWSFPGVTVAVSKGLEFSAPPFLLSSE